MATVILGPSNVGKSLLIKNAQSLGVTELNNYRVVYAKDLGEAKIESDMVIHYNLLHYQSSEDQSGKRYFNNEKVFKKLISSPIVEKFIVLVAPIRELLERAKHRVLVEEHLTSAYDRKKWIPILKKTNFFKLYEDLYQELNINNKFFDVYFSSSRQVIPFLKSDRVYSHLNLKGAYITPPPLEDVNRIARQSNIQYQPVTLPYNLKTGSKGFDHIGIDRSESFSFITEGSIQEKSILDIGSAMGELLFTAERYGSQDLTGVEINSNRFNASLRLKSMLSSQANLLNADFLNCKFHRAFDFVTILNVIHHIRDYEYFLRKAAEITTEKLIVEFPTLSDPKFLKENKMSSDEADRLNKFSFIGISSEKNLDQTYVFSPKAIHALLMDRIGGFRSYSIHNSPIYKRKIMIFTK